MGKKLTAGVLQGTAYKETMKDLEWNGELYDIEIRALSNTESIQVEEHTQEGVHVKVTPGLHGKTNRHVTFDSKANFRGRKESDIKAVALGTTDQDITEQIVRNEFPPKLVKEIAARIKQISGISENKDEEIEDLTEGKTTPSDSNGE